MNNYNFEEAPVKKDLELFEQSQDFTIGLVEALYYEGDINKIEMCIEELSSLYNIDFPKTKIRVRTK